MAGNKKKIDKPGRSRRNFLSMAAGTASDNSGIFYPAKQREHIE